VKNIVLTGPTGVVGISVINECIKDGKYIYCVVRPDSARLKFIPRSESVKIIQCGLDEIDKLPAMINGKVDAFFHLGWADTDRDGRNDKEKQEKNIGYTLKAVETAVSLGAELFVGAGSQAEYGRMGKTISEDFPPAPETAYGAAKLSAGKLSAELCSHFGIKHIWTRIFSVYGPNDSPATMIMYCIDKLLKKEKPLLTKCEQMWDYLYCSDAARALLLAGEKGSDGSIYNIGSGICRPLIEYVKILQNVTSHGLELGIGEIEYGRGQVMHLCADITKIKKDTGFKPTVNFEQGIKETMQWYRENLK